MPAVAEAEPRARVGSDAFNLNYESDVPKQSLHDEIVSYIGEYRLRLQKYDYPLRYSADGLSDPHSGESMLSKAQRTILDRRSRGLPTHREEAELKALGIFKNIMPFTKAQDAIFWASPPGPAGEGYGEYGFIFVGRIKADQRIDMTAINIPEPTLEQYGTAMTILTGVTTNYDSADSFLAAPRIVRDDMNPEIVDKVLEYVFPYRVDEKEKAKFKRILVKLNPIVEDLIDYVKMGTNAEKLKAFYSLENYALQLKREEEERDIFISPVFEPETQVRLRDIIGDYGFKPPAASGSCGSTDSSNSLFGSSRKSILKELGIEEEECNCPEGNTDNHYHCPDCGKKYADETNKTQRTKECSCGFEFGC